MEKTSQPIISNASFSSHLDRSGDAESPIPLTETTFFILLSLAPGPNHGYGIMKDVRQMSQGRVTFSTGTLYSAIKRLLDLAWILRIGEGMEEDSQENGRARKSYELSILGRKILNAEVTRMNDLVQLAKSVSIHGV